MITSDTESAATPSLAPASAPSAASDTEAAQAQIKAMNRDPTHPLHPDNRHADPAKLEQVFELYQRVHGPSRDPAHAAVPDGLAPFPPAAQAFYNDLREMACREGRLPAGMTDANHVDLVERVCLVTSD